MPCQAPASGLALLGCCGPGNQLHQFRELKGFDQVFFRSFLGTPGLYYRRMTVDVVQDNNGLTGHAEIWYNRWSQNRNQTLVDNTTYGFQNARIQSGTTLTDDLHVATWVDLVTYTITRTLSEPVSIADDFAAMEDFLETIAFDTQNNYALVTTPDGSLTVASIQRSNNINNIITSTPVNTGHNIRAQHLGTTFNRPLLSPTDILRFNTVLVRALLTNPYCVTHSSMSRGQNYFCQKVLDSGLTEIDLPAVPPTSDDILAIPFDQFLGELTRTTIHNVGSTAGLTPACCGFAP